MLRLIAALIAMLILLAVFALWLSNKWNTVKARKAARGTVPGDGTPKQMTIRDRWTTAPATVAAGTDTTFVLSVSSAQPTGMVAVTGREYIVVAPAGVKIVSINGVAPKNPAFGTTTAAGTITIVINANPVEQETPGALVAQQVSAAKSTAVSTGFKIR